MELLGDVGGLQSALYLLCSLLVGFVTKKMFLASIMREIYQVKYNRGGEGEERKRKEYKED